MPITVDMSIEFEPKANETIHKDQYIGKCTAGIFSQFNVFRRDNKTAFVIVFNRTVPIAMKNINIV